MAGPLTPDFYRYEWHPLSGVRLDGEFVVAAFGLTRLTSLSTNPNQGEEVARQVGVLRDSNFGPVWDIAIFDNRRVQHAREPFDTASGRRLLRGCYVNSDDIYSKLRVLNRRAQESELAPA